MGSSKVKLNQDKLSCKLDKVAVFRNGRPVRFDREKASGVVSSEYHEIVVNLGVGKGEDFCYGCDMSKRYVEINAEYHT